MGRCAFLGILIGKQKLLRTLDKYWLRLKNIVLLKRVYVVSRLEGAKYGREKAAIRLMFYAPSER